MPLDFVLLNEGGAPGNAISLSIKTHRQVMLDAEHIGITCFNRFLDYYSDASILPHEIGTFRSGAIAISQSSKSAPVIDFMNEILKIFEEAAADGKQVDVIAD